MLLEERQQAILDILGEEGTVVVANLATRFSVSDMTIRRDLEVLENDGLLRRVHGGAINTHRRSYEPPLVIRKAQHVEEKVRIGAAAAELVKNGDSIALDIGTTTLELAQHLHDKHDLTIITPSLQIAATLSEHPSNRVILTGGNLRRGELSMVGPLALRAFQEFFVDKAFLGIGCIDFDAGLTEFNPDDALVKRAMVNSAKEVIVMADSSKFGQIAFAVVAPLSAVHYVVTDADLDPLFHDRLTKLNIEIVLA